MKKFLMLATLLVIAASWSINAQQPAISAGKVGQSRTTVHQRDHGG